MDLDNQNVAHGLLNYIGIGTTNSHTPFSMQGAHLICRSKGTVSMTILIDKGCLPPTLARTGAPIEQSNQVAILCHHTAIDTFRSAAKFLPPGEHKP